MEYEWPGSTKVGELKIRTGNVRSGRFRIEKTQ